MVYYILEQLVFYIGLPKCVLFIDILMAINKSVTFVAVITTQWEDACCLCGTHCTANCLYMYIITYIISL